MRLGRWQQVIVDALAEQSAIGVRVTVEHHLGRPPTRAELIAARRAANQLGDAAQVVHLQGRAANEGRLVLVRPGVQLDKDALRRAVGGLPPRPATGGSGGTNTARSALTSAQRAADAARRVDADRVSVDQADVLSLELDDAIEALSQLSRQLRRRASSQAWMTTNDKKWQQHWASILTYRDQTGRWPDSRSTDPDVRSRARWIAFQRRQHRNHRLHPEREAAMRAANFRFTDPRRRANNDEDIADKTDEDPS